MTNAKADRRFIEESFPVKEVGAASVHEKNVRHGHISTLHLWWARRPLAASRATTYAALTPAPRDAEEWQKKRDFIIQLCQWENSDNQALLERARRDILEANGGVPPRVLDPFAGGGSYPLEALRLGCEAYANDYNPVAVLIEKATLEYPQKFGRPFEGMPEWALPPRLKAAGSKSQASFLDETSAAPAEDFNPLLNAVRYWGEWVLKEARKELPEFYPPDPDGNIPVGYIWAHTVPCQNPSCNIEIPLLKQYWIVNKNNNRVALCPEVDEKGLNFRIVGDGYSPWPEGFEPEFGTIANATPTCPVCNSVIGEKDTKRLFREKKSREKIMVVITKSPKKSGKIYRIANPSDYDVINLAEEILDEKRRLLREKTGFDPIPDEIVCTPNGKEYVPGGLFFKHTPFILYGMTKWSDIFGKRQKLTITVFVDQLKRASKLITDSEVNPDFSRAVILLLQLALNKFITYQNKLTRWNSGSASFAAKPDQDPTLGMKWDYAESTPFSDVTGSFSSQLHSITKSLEHLSRIALPADVKHGSALRMPFPNDSFDAVLTDPPYYDNIPYAAMSDFFYVWMKRGLGELFPELFSTPLVPKSGETIADLPLLRGTSKIRALKDVSGIKSSEEFERLLKGAFQESYRLLKPNGIAVIVYAHKSTAGWETLINSILDSNLVVSSAWPISTEREARQRAQKMAALASSIYIVARKMPRQPTGFYNDVRTELRQHLDTKLDRLWGEGIGGADFFIAAIGSAIEVFGKYEQVMDYEGNIVRADRLLEEVRTIATDYAVRQILHNGFAAEISGLTRLYVLWRWNYSEALVPFDEGRKMAQSCGIDLAQEWNKGGFVKKEKEFIRLLGPQNRKLEDLDDPRDLIDVLHKALLLWEKGQRGAMVLALADRGYGKSEAFYRVAQAISETLPNESKEKKLLDGFLAGRERVQDEVEKAEQQGRLFG